MGDGNSTFWDAFVLVLSLDADLYEIIGLSLYVSLTAVLVACLVGIPLGAILAITRFPGRGGVNCWSMP